MNNTLHEAQMKLQFVKLIIQNIHTQHRAGPHVSLTSTVSVPLQQYIHLRNVMVLICSLWSWKKCRWTKHFTQKGKRDTFTKLQDWTAQRYTAYCAADSWQCCQLPRASVCTLKLQPTDINWPSKSTGKHVITSIATVHVQPRLCSCV